MHSVPDTLTRMRLVPDLDPSIGEGGKNPGMVGKLWDVFRLAVCDCVGLSGEPFLGLAVVAALSVRTMFSMFGRSADATAIE